MSTSTAPSYKDMARERLSGSLERYMKDIKHFSAEQLAASPGGKARSALSITAEVGLFNHACAKMLAGDTSAEMNEEKMGEMMASIDSAEKATETLTSGTAALREAIANCSDDDYKSEITAPWGQPVTKEYLANMCAMHMDYHDGQINIIQCMNGDTEVHWMDE